MKKIFLFLMISSFVFSQYLVYAVLDEPRALNVWLDYGPHARTWSKYVFRGKYRSLYRLSHLTFEFVPDLAEDLPKIHKEGKFTVYEITLREDLKWSDGKLITSKDVAFTLNSAVELVKKGLGGNWAVMVDPEFFDHAEVVNDRTVKLYFKKTGFLRVEYGVLMAPIIQKDYWKEHVEQALRNGIEYLFDIDTVSKPDPSSGPFILKRWEKGAFIELEAVRDYFDRGYTEIHYENGAIVLKHPNGYIWMSGEPSGDEILRVEMGPFVDGVIYRIYSSRSNAVQALLKGEVDLILNPVGLQPGEMRALSASKEIVVLSSPSLNPRYLGFNLDKSPMKYKAFRKAIAYLLDMDFISTKILNSSVMPIDSLIPNTNPRWFNPGVRLPGRGMDFKERLEIAYRVLKEAGFKWVVEPVFENGKLVRNGKGLMDPDGKRVEEIILLAPNESYDVNRSVVAIYLENWANRIGIPIKARLMDFKAVIENVWYRRDFDMFILGWGPVLTPEHLVNYFMTNAPYNVSHYSNTEFDDMAEKLLTSDEEEAIDIARKLQEILNEDLPFIPLFVPILNEAYRKDLIFPYTNVVSGLQFFGGFPEFVRKVGE